MKNRAFTLVEMIMVMIIITILSVTAMISLNAMGTVRLDAAAKRMAADIRFARSLALSTSRWYGVSVGVDPSNNYTIYQTDGVTDTPIKDPAALQKDLSINLSNVYNGVVITSVNIGGGSKVEFHPLGTPYTDKNGAAISAPGTISLEYGGKSKTITITPNTGKIGVQ